MKICLEFLLHFCLFLCIDGSRRPKITPPLQLKTGETPIQEPGWSHCITKMKATGKWKNLRSPGYPKLPSTQMQCSWIIEAPIGWRTVVAFKDMNMAESAGAGVYQSCRAAYVNIVDVSANKSQGRFCGTTGPGDYVSMGPKLRIDLHTDKSVVRFRGFIVSYRAVRVQPGFRPVRRSAAPTAPGKVNLNEFKSTQQRIINSGGRPAGSQTYGPGPKRPIYASETTTLSPKLLTTTDSRQGWAGIGALPPVGKPSRGRGSTAGAKIKAKPKPKPRPLPKGNKIVATNQQRQNNRINPNTDTGGRIQATSETPEENGWVEGDAGSQPNSQFYGPDSQPAVIIDPYQRNVNNPLSVPKNYVLVQEDGLSVVHLIIIVCGTIACIVLLAGIFLIKHFVCDKRQKRRERRQNEQQNKSVEMDDVVYSTNREVSLPGLSRAGSMHSIHSQGGAVGFGNQNLSRHTSVAPGRALPPHRNFSRHQALVAEHDSIYRNHREMMMMQSNHGGLQRQPSEKRRAYAMSQKRPLPPLPKQSKGTKPSDIDEDYCSGSDEDPDVTTMRRELSPWEIQQKKKNRFRDKRI